MNTRASDAAEFAALEADFHRLRALPANARAAELAVCSESVAYQQALANLLAAADTTDACFEPLFEAAIEAGPLTAADSARDATPSIGSLIGPWRLLGELGSGGMGTVFAAERADGQYATEVAIKLLRGFPTEDAMARLRQERQILAALDHPNIARLLDGGETAAGQPYLVLERVRGQSLQDWLQRAPRSLSARLKLFGKLCAAVIHAHQQLVVHRDIKPSNVLVRLDDEPKLLDFGVSKLLDWHDDQQTSTRVFSRGYTSPEQAAGQRISTRSDVYSLGVLLAAMLSGRPPPDGQQRWSALPIDAELASIIAGACAERPEDRYASVADLAADLDRYHRGLPLQRRPPSPLYRLQKLIRRHRLVSSVVALALALSGLGVLRLYQETERAQRAEATALIASERSDRRFQLLSEVFAGIGNPDEHGQALDANGLLDRARDRLQQTFLDDPGEAAPFERLLGDAYLRAERWQDAERMYAASVAHANDLSDLQVRRALREWARMLIMQDKPSEALAVLDRAPEQLHQAPASSDEAELQIRFALTRLDALTALQTGNLEAISNDASAYADQYLPPGHQLRGMLRFRRAQAMELAGQYTELVAARRAVLREWSADPYANAGDLGFQELNLARAMRLAGEPAAPAWQALHAAEQHANTSFGGQLSALKYQIDMERAALAWRDHDLALTRQHLSLADQIASQIDVEDDADSKLLRAEVWLAEGSVSRAAEALHQAEQLPKGPMDLDRLARLKAAWPKRSADAVSVPAH